MKRLVLLFALVLAAPAAADPVPPNPDGHGPLWPWHRGGIYLPQPTACRTTGDPARPNDCSIPGPTGYRHRIPPR